MGCSSSVVAQPAPAEAPAPLANTSKPPPRHDSDDANANANAQLRPRRVTNGPARDRRGSVGDLPEDIKAQLRTSEDVASAHATPAATATASTSLPPTPAQSAAPPADEGGDTGEPAGGDPAFSVASI